MRFTYGVWDGEVTDARAGAAPSPDGIAASAAPFPEEFAEFSPGNPVLAFLSGKGFAIFSETVSLPAVLLKHHENLARHSCGRCTPCRAGAQIILGVLRAACEGKGRDADWDAALAVALHMRDSSFCGIGKTGVVPFIEALAHFPDLLKNSAPAVPAPGVYALATSPCIEACPAHVEVPRYVDAVRDGREDRGVAVMLEHYPLVGSCGRICVRLCEHACRRGRVDAPVGIRNLKRFLADVAPVRSEGHPAGRAEKAEAAVIGAGPAGLACAYHLLCAGHTVDIFDAAPAPGGMARYGIPAYRLPKDVLDEEAGIVEALGGRFLFNKALGRDFTLSGLREEGYRAIFVGIGASVGQLLRLPEDENPPTGYENGISFLRRVHDGVMSGTPPELHGDVVVVGGGNVAMDCCRSATRLTGGKVHVLYRRTEGDLPADREEIEEARHEGVEFHFLALPAGLVVKNGCVAGVRVRKMQQGEPDASGRRSVSPVEGEDWELACSGVIAAIGQQVKTGDIPQEDGIEWTRKGTIAVDGHLAASRPGVFAGGDCVTGPDTLIGALAQGERAARAMCRELDGKSAGFSPRERMCALFKAGRLLDEADDACTHARPGGPRQVAAVLPPPARLGSFAEVDRALSSGAARAEADRCLRCYRLFTIVTGAPIPDQD